MSPNSQIFLVPWKSGEGINFHLTLSSWICSPIKIDERSKRVNREKPPARLSLSPLNRGIIVAFEFNELWKENLPQMAWLSLKRSSSIGSKLAQSQLHVYIKNTGNFYQTSELEWIHLNFLFKKFFEFVKRNKCWINI